MRIHAPYTHVPYHQRIDDGFVRFVNNDHCLLSARTSLRLPAYLPASLSYLPAAQTLWYVPTGEVLPRKKWSISAYRVNFDDNQGFSDVSNWPLTFGVGLSDRAELFGSWVLVSRVDRDIRPLFVSAIPLAGGTVPQNPLMADTWSGSKLGDFWLGAKLNLMSQWQQKAFAFALRPMIKLPTGDKDNGASTGAFDFAFDATGLAVALLLYLAVLNGFRSTTR